MFTDRLLKSSNGWRDLSHQALQDTTGRLSDRFSQTDELLPSLQVCRRAASSDQKSQQSQHSSTIQAESRRTHAARRIHKAKSKAKNRRRTALHRQALDGTNLASDTLTSNSLGSEGLTAEWTVLVYMAGNSLESYGIEDFLEMAAAGSDQKVNVVVQFDRTAGYASTYGNWTDTRRGLIRAEDTPSLNWGTSIGEVNMGDANTLKNFVDWGTSTYQAKHYALVMWGHGDGFKVASDDLTRDAITGNELNSVLAGQTHKIELVGADACLMSTTEFAYEISENASVFVGSQELESGTGWNYTSILQDLKAAPTLTAAQLGTAIVDRYSQTYTAGQTYASPFALTQIQTLSAINLAALRSSNLSGLTGTLNTFANTLMTTATSDDLDFLSTIRGLFADDFAEGGTDLCDVGKLFTQVINTETITATVRSAAQAVLNAYGTTVIHNFTAVPGRSSGLSLYFSDRGARPIQGYGLNYSFIANTQWDDFLNWLWW